MEAEVNSGPRGAVPETLKWCVGKFVYVRGSDLPLHFMELKRFIIDDAIDYSHLFYLRALRARLGDEAYLDDALRKWMDGTAVQAVAEAVEHAATGFGDGFVVGEFSPGVGLTGEYVKLLVERRAAAGGAVSSVALYEGYGAPAGRNRFEVLHKDAGSSVAYFDECDAISADAERARHVLVLNLNQSLRMDVACSCSLEEFLRLRAGAKVISMRVSTGAVSVDHTTVKGRIVTLPSMQSVVDLLRATGLAWHTRFVRGFDEGFLIPDGGEPCGLLIAYLASTPQPKLARFTPATSVQ
jgi:hypothetical protein